jgi:hypothetical protein
VVLVVLDPSGLVSVTVVVPSAATVVVTTVLRVHGESCPKTTGCAVTVYIVNTDVLIADAVTDNI